MGLDEVMRRTAKPYVAGTLRWTDREAIASVMGVMGWEWAVPRELVLGPEVARRFEKEVEYAGRS